MARSRLVTVAALAALAGCSGSRLPATRGVSGNDRIDDHGVLRAGVCRDAELRPDFSLLTEETLVNFLQRRGFAARLIRARSDLAYVELLHAAPNGETSVRLRVARLRSAPEAGQELHDAVLQHGTGSWGVHRSNLAVLAPAGSPDRIVAFAASTGLACWGVLTVAGQDDAYVIPGGYREL